MTDDDVETFLEDISRCFVDRDFDLWSSVVLLPLSLITQDGPVFVTDHDALKQNFNHYLAAMRIMHLDTVARRALSCEDCRDGTWIVTYETELLSHGTRATEPYVSSALMVRRDGRYRLRSILNARGHHHWTGVSPPSTPK